MTGTDCTTAGGHYNPDENLHSGPTSTKRHVGDLGNIEADAQGNATIDVTSTIVFVSEMDKNNVVGRAFVVHAKADDLGLGGDQGS